MDSKPVPPAEADLIGLAREAAGLTITEAARRVSATWPDASVSTARWSQIEQGYEVRGGRMREVRAKPGMLARMARIVRATPERLAEEGKRPDAAKVLREILRSEEEASAVRLGGMFVERRLYLGFTERAAFAGVRGINPELVRKAEHGMRASLSQDDVATLAGAYEVTRESVTRALAGDGVLEPAPAQDAPKQVATEPEPPADTAAEEMISAVISIAASREEVAIEREIARYPEGAPAEQIFADEVEQAIWRQASKSRAERVRQLAAFRAVSHPKVSRRVS